jgi:hypothetical protein
LAIVFKPCPQVPETRSDALDSALSKLIITRKPT